MGVFKKERRFHPGWRIPVEPIVADLVDHFQRSGYQVTQARTGAGAWDVDVTRKSAFRTVLGMRTSLRIRLEQTDETLVARAGVGVLGQQILPTAITVLVFWPVILTQVWGVIQSARIDNEAIAIVELSVDRMTGRVPFAAPPEYGTAVPADVCDRCGDVGGSGAFCTSCGNQLWPV